MDYLITGWCGVPYEFLSEERFVEVKEAGFNVIPANYPVEDAKKALVMAEKVGIKLCLEDHRIYEAIKNPEKIDELIKAVTEDFKDFEGLYGYHVFDEPNEQMFETLAKIREAFDKYDPKHYAYMNLFPNYASNEQLGSNSYKEHVEKYIDVIKPYMVSYDHYHFLVDTPNVVRVNFTDKREADIYRDAQKRVSRPGFFDNLEIVRKASLERNVPYMLIVLLVQHGPYRYLSRAELKWEVWQTLAYGCCGTNFFTYWTPDCGPVWGYCNGMISMEGEKLEHYYDAQSCTKDAKAVGDIIVNEKSTAVFHVGEESENVTQFVPYGGISSISGGNFTVGFFTGDYVIVVNKNYEATACAKIETDKRLEIFDIDSKTWRDFNGEIQLGKGEGALVRFAHE